MKIFFNLRMSSTRTDAVRIVDGTANVADDLDSRVLFSSEWPSMRVEKFAISRSVQIGVATSQTGRITLAREYGAWPLLFGAYRNISDGKIIYPHFKTWTQTTTNNGGAYASVTPKLRSHLSLYMQPHGSLPRRYVVDWYINQAGEFPFRDGVLYIFAIGKAG